MTVTVRNLDGGTRRLPEAALRDLEQRLEGRILRPGDEGYGDAIRIWNGMIHKRPALVVQPASPSDVAACADLAREHRILLSVKGGGHNIAGTALADGGLTLDMARFKDVAVDPEARTVRVGAGCLLQDVDRATQEHGLATVLGFVSETGVAGLTLGGGFGYLTRRFGFAVDNLLDAEIVTADGRVRQASRDEHEDLFWALRGAGHNFGVVTNFTFRLHEVGPTIYGGLIAWPFERAEQVLGTYRKLTAESPRELTVFLVMMRAPPAPFVPPAWHGRRVVVLLVCYSGDLDRAEAVLEPLRALGDPVVDLLAERSYVEQQSLMDVTEPKGLHYYWKTEFARELAPDLLGVMRDLARECPMPMAQLVVAHLGGAINERATDDGAVGNRDVHFTYGAAGMWEPAEPNAEAYRDWVRQAWKAVRPFSSGGNYVNFQTADEGLDRVRATYGKNLERLVKVKTRYDPGNLFRSNRNIPPRTAETTGSREARRASRSPS